MWTHRRCLFYVGDAQPGWQKKLIIMDPKTEQLLTQYKKEVEKVARGAYLQAIALKNEVLTSKLNPDDRLGILIHCISLLTQPRQAQPTEEKSK
jgi:hypothetical protein